MSKKLKKKKNQTNNELNILLGKLKKAIGSYLDNRVIKPALQTVDKEFTVQQDIVTILIILTHAEQLILDHGAELYLENLASLPKEKLEEIINILEPFIAEPNEVSCTNKVREVIDKQINKKHLLSYLVREINWISISILSASYISSLILTRSVFELLIGIATSQAGGMSSRIESINYLTPEEHKHLKDAWNNLNAWAHPYGKWEKEICPIFYSSEPLYHPKIYKECYSFLTVLIDLFLTIAVERFKISPAEITESSRNIGGDIVDASFKVFPLFFRRLSDLNNAVDNKPVHSDAPKGGA
jgi:hypothetical protein